MMPVLGSHTVLLAATLCQKSRFERCGALCMHLPDSLSTDFPSHLTPVIPEQWLKRLGIQHVQVACSSHYLQFVLYLQPSQITRMAQFKRIISLFYSLSLPCALVCGLKNDRVILSSRNWLTGSIVRVSKLSDTKILAAILARFLPFPSLR